MGRRASSFWHSRGRASSAPPTPSEPPIGCMSMVHYLIFAPGAGCVGRPPASSASGIVTPRTTFHGLDDANNNGGLEAPRNSLDLDADNPSDIHIGVQIEPVFDALARTGCVRRPKAAKTTAPSSEAETPRTPSLVARLMGIDGLPSPSPGQQQRQAHKKKTTSSKKHVVVVDNKENMSATTTPAGNTKEKKKRVIPESMNREPLRSLSCNVGAGEARSRSLPDTPRASTSARASWDGPRLSLQALKENVLDRAAQYMSMPSSPTSSSSASGKRKDAARRRRDERERGKAAKEHAREILRQAKETVASRKTASSKENKAAAAEKRRPSFNDKENVMSPAAASPAMVEDKGVVLVQAAGSRPAEAPAASNKPQSAEHPPCHSQSHSPRVPLAPRQPPPPPQRAKPSRPPPPPPPLDPPPTRARRPDGCERFATRIKKPAAGAGAGSAPQSPCAPPPGSGSNSTACCSVPLEEDPEYSYLRTVLERGGFMRSPPRRRALAQRQYYSVASPVDPIVFHLLELELPAEEARLGPLRHRWNRKLLFHVAQEVLAELLLLGVGGGGAQAQEEAGPPLLRKVWGRVRGFPAADCRVVGDIDALVAADLESSRAPRRLGSHPGVAEEAGDVADEVAERVLEALVGECVAESVSLSFLRSCRRSQQLAVGGDRGARWIAVVEGGRAGPA